MFGVYDDCPSLGETLKGEVTVRGEADFKVFALALESPL